MASSWSCAARAPLRSRAALECTGDLFRCWGLRREAARARPQLIRRPARRRPRDDRKPEALRCLGDAAGGREWYTRRRRVPCTGCGSKVPEPSVSQDASCLCFGCVQPLGPLSHAHRSGRFSDTGRGLNCTSLHQTPSPRTAGCTAALQVSSCSHGGRAATATTQKTSQETAARDGTRRPRHALLFASHRSLRSRWLRGLRAPDLPARRARPAAAAGPAARELS